MIVKLHMSMSACFLIIYAHLSIQAQPPPRLFIAINKVKVIYFNCLNFDHELVLLLQH